MPGWSNRDSGNRPLARAQGSSSHCAERSSNAADSHYCARPRLAWNPAHGLGEIQRVQSVIRKSLGRGYLDRFRNIDTNSINATGNLLRRFALLPLTGANFIGQGIGQSRGNVIVGRLRVRQRRFQLTGQNQRVQQSIFRCDPPLQVTEHSRPRNGSTTIAEDPQVSFCGGQRLRGSGRAQGPLRLFAIRVVRNLYGTCRQPQILHVRF